MGASTMSRNRSVWLEAAINGAAGRMLQPNIPVAEDEIVADAVECARAGAAIIHLHAYDPDGAPCEDAAIYARLIEGVRTQCDAIVYPTLALSGTADERFAPVRELGRRDLLEMGVVDPGSVNIAHKLHLAMGTDGFVYPNPVADIREGLRLAAQDGWRPAFAIYEPGFARLGAALAGQQSGLATPVYRVMFSDGLLFGLAPSEENLRFYARHLDEVAPGAPTMLSGLDADTSPLIPLAVELGFHVRVGLEDAPFGTTSRNADLVARAADAIRNAGGKVASADEIRSAP